MNHFVQIHTKMAPRKIVTFSHEIGFLLSPAGFLLCATEIKAHLWPDSDVNLHLWVLMLSDLIPMQ